MRFILREGPQSSTLPGTSDWLTPSLGIRLFTEVSGQVYGYKERRGYIYTVYSA